MISSEIRSVMERVKALDKQATPGPWAVDDSPYSDYTFGPKMEMIADACPECASYRMRGHGGGLPQKQNANLIAEFRTAAPLLVTALEEREGQTCEWIDSESSDWSTGCGHVFQFIDDGPEENGFKFCCYCGGALIVAADGPRTPEGDDEHLRRRLA